MVGAVTLAGNNTVSSTVTLTTSGITVNGTGNVIGTGTVTGAITQNASSGLAVTGTAGNDALANLATLSGTGTVGAVTLAGNNTVSSTATLTTGGITVSGTGNVIGTGAVTGAITQNSSSALTVSGTAGSDALNTGATLSGTGSGSVTTVTLAGTDTVNGPLTTTSITVNGTGNTLTGTQTATNGVAIVGAGAVSYTHLDVYKRQIIIDPSGTYIGNATLASDAGDFFQLTSGNFVGATLSTPPAFTDTGLTWITSLIKKGILFVEPSAGGNLINSGVVLPIGNDSEFNPIGSAAFNVTFNGGELLTANNSSTLDTGGTSGTPYTTSNLIGINTTGGTIASVTGNTATYNGICLLYTSRCV